MTSRPRNVWASDVPVSRPEPVDPLRLPVLVDMGGYGMTSGGLVHNLSSSDSEEIFSPTFRPEGDHG